MRGSEDTRERRSHLQPSTVTTSVQGASVAWEEVSIGLCLRGVLFFSRRSPSGRLFSRDLGQTIKRDPQSLDLIGSTRAVRVLFFCADNFRMIIIISVFR